MSEIAENASRSKKQAAPTQLPDDLQLELVNIFKLLADETRFRVLMYLFRDGELHVNAMCNLLNQSQPAVSHHLALLRDSGLIACRRDGKHNFYSLQPSSLHQIARQFFQCVADPNQTTFQFDGFALTTHRAPVESGNKGAAATKRT